MKKIIVCCFLLLSALLLACCGAEKRSSEEIIKELTLCYATYGEKADEKTKELLKELKTVDADLSERWESIMQLWKTCNTTLSVNEGILPDGLKDTDELCLIALGFQLNADGSIREELEKRLEVVKACAQKYPNAWILCTGGPTAAGNKSVTEAGKMAEWLIQNGVSKDRILVEDRSVTTAQNAIFSYDLLSENYPQVSQLAIISSDYHIATGRLLFDAEAVLRAEKAGQEKMRVVSNAAYPAPAGSLSPTFQAGALIELTGDKDSAYDIYYGTYDLRELPSLD